MVLGTQRTIEATDLWELEPSFASAELLSNRLQTIWERRQAEAAAYNLRLHNGDVKAGSWPRLKWAVGRGNEDEWRKTARKRASLIWTCNELVGSLGKARNASESSKSLNWWWIGGAYKRCVRLILLDSTLTFADASVLPLQSSATRRRCFRRSSSVTSLTLSDGPARPERPASSHHPSAKVSERP